MENLQIGSGVICFQREILGRDPRERFWGEIPERDSAERSQRERFCREIPERDSGERENLW